VVAAARRALPAVTRRLVAIGALALALRLVYGAGVIGYDAVWALVWGQQIAGGALPALGAAGAPSPHPLAIAVSALLAPLGAHAFAAVLALSWLSLGALGWLAFRLGRELYSPWVGGLFAALLLTRPLLVLETQQAVIDVPFLALVVAAMLAALRSPRRVPLWLGLAGLLRPEAWLLGLAWAARAAGTRARLTLAGAALAAPLAWAALDLLTTGDPLHSLHGTQSLAEQLGRPRELDTALRSVPGYLRFVLTAPVAWVGLAGAAAALLGLYARTLLPAAVTGLGLLAFLVLGATGLPLLTRYLLLPATLLTLACAVAALGFTTPGARDARWRAGGALALAVLLIALPGQRAALRGAVAVADARRPVQRDLARILDAVRAAPCAGRLSVPDDRPHPFAACLLARPPGSVRVERTVPAAGGGPALTYRSESAGAVYRIGPAAPAGAPPGRRPLSGNGTWLATC
jgi:hypothetical protein